MLPPFLEYLEEGAAVYVHAPTDVIFLCGGKTRKASTRILSLRDAFLKVPDNRALEGRHVMLAESVNTYHQSRPAYADLLQFEVDLAQICELILLFSESEGSIAELGAFSMVEEIAKKILVIIRDYHLKYDSFIKLGPLQHLKNKYGDHSFYVINDDVTGLSGKSVKSLKPMALRDRLLPAIEARFPTVKERTTLDRSRNGHLIKLMVGLIQEFGGLRADEIQVLLRHFDLSISNDSIDRLLLCAEAVEWISKDQRGYEHFYFSHSLPRSAVTLKFHRGAPVFNSGRRRQAIRDYWRLNDQQRYSGIVHFAGESK